MRAIRAVALAFAVHHVAAMTTIGQLIEALFTKYERQLHDPEAAAEATKRELDGILRARRRR